MATSIEWTDETWNPTYGCSIISPGCHHCYAMSMARRQTKMVPALVAKGKDPGKSRHYLEVIGDDGRWNGNMVLAPEALDQPRGWRKPRMIFVNSMSDLFHENLPVDDVRQICQVMAEVSRHTYQVLTKRAERMRELLSGPLREFAMLPHVWWGVSVENQRHGLPRIEHLRQTPASKRFLSVEPLLEDLGSFDLTGIHWVIVGGESDHGARPMEEAWVRSVMEPCQSAGVPFFFKQWGGVQKKKAGRLLDGRTWDEMPSRREPVPIEAVGGLTR
jgi:protein gp37